jgi:septal ring factor EnvC (AmiA/AmiB activator)
MDSLLPALSAAVITFAAAVASFAAARRLGLTAVQRSFAEESARLANTQAARIAVLEAERAEDREEIERLKSKVRYLQDENDELRRRLDVMERILTERGIG